MRHIKRTQLRRGGVVIDGLLAGHGINRNLDGRVLVVSPVERYRMIRENGRWDELGWRVDTHRWIEFEFFEVGEVAGEDCGFEFSHEGGVAGGIVEVRKTTVSVCLVDTADWFDGIGVFTISQASLQVGRVV